MSEAGMRNAANGVGSRFTNWVKGVLRRNESNPMGLPIQTSDVDSQSGGGGGSATVSVSGGSKRSVASASVGRAVGMTDFGAFRRRKANDAQS